MTNDGSYDLSSQIVGLVSDVTDIKVIENRLIQGPVLMLPPALYAEFLARVPEKRAAVTPAPQNSDVDATAAPAPIPPMDRGGSSHIPSAQEMGLSILEIDRMLRTSWDRRSDPYIDLYRHSEFRREDVRIKDD